MMKNLLLSLLLLHASSSVQAWEDDEKSFFRENYGEVPIRYYYLREITQKRFNVPAIQNLNANQLPENPQERIGYEFSSPKQAKEHG